MKNHFLIKCLFVAVSLLFINFCVAQTNEDGRHASDLSSSNPEAHNLHFVTGLITELSDTMLTLKKRNGSTIQVNYGPAAQNYMISGLYVGKPVIVRASSIEDEPITAISVSRAKENPASWLPDN